MNVVDIYTYTTEPPPEPSPRLAYWLARVRAGFRPNKRLRGLGYDNRAAYYGVYVWELFNILDPALKTGGRV